MPLIRPPENCAIGLTSVVSMPRYRWRTVACLITAPEEFQIKQLEDILRDKLASRGVDVRYLEPGDVEGAGKVKRKTYGLRQGIDRDTAKQITKMTKDSKIKVQAQVNGEKVRVTGKKRDDLQAIMALLREADIALPLQFDNFRD